MADVMIAPTELSSMDVRQLNAALRGRALSSVELTSACLDRIDAVNPLVAAVLAVDETALDQAAESDRRHAAGVARGPLDGIPVLLKDNIDTAGLATTAGSRLLAGAPPARDAAIVGRLRAAGAVILGKTNMTEWANFRSTEGAEGWSAVGGQTRNPYVLRASPWGSSAGSAVAVATGMAPLALGTETDGSIVCPAGVNGVVGLKPEIGLLPIGGIVPISEVVDVVGPLAARVSDVALCMAALTGRDEFDAAPLPLVGRRLGLWRVRGMPAGVEQALDQLSAALQAAGVVVLPVELEVPRDMLVDGLRALYAEFRPSLENYLRTRAGVPDTLPELIAANLADPRELSLFGQDLFETTAGISAEKRAAWLPGRGPARDAARRLLSDAMRRHHVDALLAPTNEPAWVIDYDSGDPHARNSSTAAALAGYPNISIPAGFVGELPVGISVFGPPALATLLPVALAVEQACGMRRPPSFRR